MPNVDSRMNGNYRTEQLTTKGEYGVDKFRCSWHMYLPEFDPPIPILQGPESFYSTKPIRVQLPENSPAKMVIAIDKVTETVATVARPSYQETSVYTQLEISDHRRHKEQINFRPVLHPVRYADTHFLRLNNTWKRFVSRTFYEPRVRPRSFAETTYNYPKTADQLFVSYLDFHVDENRKWYKTCVEIKAKKFTSAQILRSPNNNYINTGTTTTTTTVTGQNSLGVPNGLPMENGTANHLSEVSLAAGRGQSVQEKYDPGASQVYIPKRRERPFDHQALVNGELILNFPNSKVELNGDADEDEDYSDSEV